jgi:regulation of enolase protein 1 (concanavalin A-like superfamily)
MLLERLKDFFWLNDPLDVCFNDKGMNVLSREKTDFWQAAHHKFCRDNGHFFYTRRQGDFSLAVKWSFPALRQFQQCGLMVRIDECNWIKASLMYDDAGTPRLGSSVTQMGYSDWASQTLEREVTEIWYHLKRVNGDYVVSYSLDGASFRQIRLVHLIHDETEVKAGAYACSPSLSGFEAVLEQIDFE